MIRNVVFDIGWVFVNLDYRPLREWLGAHGVGPGDIEEIRVRIALEEHESGRMDGHELLDRIVNLAEGQLAHEVAREKWLDMFELQPGMVALANRIAERQRVYLLSNIGDLHWAHLCDEYAIDRIGHGALPSYVTGYLKPDPRIYAEAERRFDLEPTATVFVDDREDNIAAARERGWHGIVHRGQADTERRLQDLGVQF
jgi:HAD superfamily hydrolase (TIGR01509 family)